jgi:hypothetical protein
LGVLAAVEPWFTSLAHEQESGAGPMRRSQPDGRVHVVPSTRETARLGVFDATLPPILIIESGASSDGLRSARSALAQSVANPIPNSTGRGSPRQLLFCEN